MQVKLLKQLVEEMSGENSDRIVDILFNKKDVNEFLIAKKMELTINQVRNILYKLSAEGLVSFIRKKDKRKGWYIYYWTLDTGKSLIKLEQSLLEKIKELRGKFDNRKLKRYYICHACSIEVSEETALENNFTCNECAEVYELSDNQKEITIINKETKSKQKELAVIQEELKQINEKERKKREKQERKEQKEKEKERLKKLKKRRRLKLKEQKESGKLKPKAKTKKSKKQSKKKPSASKKTKPNKSKKLKKSKKK